jgi:hypothetical protein
VGTGVRDLGEVMLVGMLTGEVAEAVAVGF